MVVGDNTVTQHTIMIVDDDVMNRELLQTVFERYGYSALHAANGPQALRLAETEQPSLIICDVRMAGMDGYEVCAQIKDSAATSHIPVIMLSAYDNDTERQKALAARADDFIPKLHGWQKLIERIKQLLSA
jgi:two-component system cell cycle response regulator